MKTLLSPLPTAEEVALARESGRALSAYLHVGSNTQQIDIFEYGINPSCFEGTNLPVFIATAHNNPKEAISAMVKYVRKGCSGILLDGYKNKSVRQYGVKTVVNYNALNGRI